MNSIGTESESSLHRALKFHYTGEGGKTEAEVAGFVADGIRPDGDFIEVQTGSFAPLKEKVKEFASRGRVWIIYPIIITRYIEVYAPFKDGKKKTSDTQTGELLYRRKSPLRKNTWDLFNALVHAPELPLISGLSIELALVDIVEKRLKDGKGSWRRRGISILDKELSLWHETILLEKPEDYYRFTPFTEKEEFTVKQLAQKAKINENIARKTLYVLTKINIVKRVGKKGNAIVYTINNAGKNPKQQKKSKKPPAQGKGVSFISHRGTEPRG